MIIYLDYAKVLPYNGGELVYLDEIASHVPDKNCAELEIMLNGRGEEITTPRRRKRLLLGDGLLVYIIYSISFVLFFNSGTNSMQFGRMALICITTGRKGDTDDVSTDVDRDGMRFIGVFVLSLICLSQYFSARFGRSLNKTLAVLKILMLLGLLVTAGIAASGEKASGDWSTYHGKNDTEKGYSTGISTAKAFLSVLFSFQGWENATFVTGEIREHSVLRKGFIIAVVTVGCFYLTITAAFLHFIREDSERDTNYAPMLTGKDARSVQAWAAMAALSSFVKQAIAQADILPWSSFWKQDDKLMRNDSHHSDPAHEFLYKSPQGGLIIHWIMSAVLIVATIDVDSMPEAVGLPGNIQTYIQCAVLAFLGAAFFRLKSREEALWPDPNASNRRDERKVVIKWLLYGAILVYVLVNAAVLVATTIEYNPTEGGSNAVRGWAFPVILAVVLFTGTLYYSLFFGAATRRYEQTLVAAGSDDDEGEELPTSQPWPPLEMDGPISQESRWNLMRLAGIQCEIRKDSTYDLELERVYRFGRRWRIIYHLRGDEGYRPRVSQPTEHSNSMFLYWLFGGSRLPDAWTPWLAVFGFRASRGTESQNLTTSQAN
ncbi:hypothetical protein CEP51_004019 [Fusarium floridanum]|uniref:Amino acid permease/ SLC12A domain-containing protein n=1 Tax=Fusarium floridanum TaxID=1325733 RepID=A0A428S381_9HYPO|nr:hypothetical protein CEP51_004019 [Fusarium floridanum]